MTKIQEYRMLTAMLIFIFVIVPFLIYYSIKKENEAISHNAICDTTTVVEREDSDSIKFEQLKHKYIEELAWTGGGSAWTINEGSAKVMNFMLTDRQYLYVSLFKNKIMYGIYGQGVFMQITESDAMKILNGDTVDITISKGFSGISGYGDYE